MAHKQKVPSRAPAGDLLLMLAMRGLEQGDGTALRPQARFGGQPPRSGGS